MLFHCNINVHEWAIATLCLTNLVACFQTDTEPPAPPIVNDIQLMECMPTRVAIRGTAEFGSVVHIVGFDDKPVVADPYTAQFTILHDLEGTEEIELVATDSSNNSSAPTEKITLVADEFTRYPAAISLTIDNPTLAIGETMTFTTEVTDLCQDRLDEVTVGMYTNAPGAIVSNNTVSGLQTAGEYTLVAEVWNTGIVDSKPFSVEHVTDSPAVEILSPGAGERFFPGATFSVDIAASADVGLSKVSLRTMGAIQNIHEYDIADSPLSNVHTFPVSIPADKRWGRLELVAEARDTGENVATSRIVTVFVDPALNEIVHSGDLEVHTLSEGALLNQPRGVSWRGASVYVATQNTSTTPPPTSEILKIDRSTGEPTVFATQLPYRAMDLAYDTTGNRFFVSIVSPSNNTIDQIVAISETGLVSDFIMPDTANYDRIHGLAMGAGWLWATDYDSNMIRRFDPANASASVCSWDPTKKELRGIAFTYQYAIAFTETEGEDEVWLATINPGNCPTQQSLRRLAEGSDVNDPRDIVEADSGHLYYVNNGNGRLMQLRWNGWTYERPVVIAANFAAPWGLTFQGDVDDEGMGHDELFVTDKERNVVYVVKGDL